jgi:glutathione S-transferase
MTGMGAKPFLARASERQLLDAWLVRRALAAMGRDMSPRRKPTDRVLALERWTRRRSESRDQTERKGGMGERGREAAREVWEQVEAKLAKQGTGWAAGEGYSVAGPYIFTFWTWGRGKALGYDMARDFPRWTEHAMRMGERGAVRRALAREGIAAP